jgi:predicted DCC family thiol-disulfide oxidoreductase YuxK
MRRSVGTGGYGAHVGELTVLYDEGCPLCVRLTGPLGSDGSVAVAAIGSETGARLLHDLTPEERYASVHVVDGDGRRRSGAEALPPMLRRVRGGRPLAWLVERSPRVAAVGYDLAARNRARLSRLLLARQARSVSRR